jgi:hypothetical protein
MKSKINFNLILGLIIDIAVIFFIIVAFENLDIKSALLNKPNSFVPAVFGILSYVLAMFVRASMFTKRLDKEMTLFEALNIIVIGNCANLVLPFRLANKLVRGRLYPPRYKDMSGRKKYIIVSFFLSDTICIFITAMLAIWLGGFTKDEFKLRLVYVLSAAFILLALILIVISFITSIKEYVLIFVNLDLLYITVINMIYHGY